MAIMQKERMRPLTLAEQQELTTITQASSERVDRVRRSRSPWGVSFTAGSQASTRGYR